MHKQLDALFLISLFIISFHIWDIIWKNTSLVFWLIIIIILPYILGLIYSIFQKNFINKKDKEWIEYNNNMFNWYLTKFIILSLILIFVELSFLIFDKEKIYSIIAILILSIFHLLFFIDIVVTTLINFVENKKHLFSIWFKK